VSTPEILVHPDAELLAKAVAARLVTRLVDAVAATGHAHLVLTGGGIGTAVLAELAAAPARDAVDWRQVDFWWGDERFVPAGNPDRNETGARSALLDRINLDPARVHPMPGPDRPVVAVRGSPKPPPIRISLTFPSIQAAREVWILASGEEKAGAVALALSGSGPVQLPAAGARGRQRTLFLLDEAAAAKLPHDIGRPAAH